MKSGKTRIFILLASAAWVIILAYAAGRRIASKNGGPEVRVITNTVQVFVTNAPEVVKVVETNQIQWAQLESEDYRTYIARLRAIGCPEQTIRDIIIADLDKLLAPRMQATGASHQNLRYWETDDKTLQSPEAYRERLNQKREIDFEKRDIILELLGIDLVTERANNEGGEDPYGRRLGFLSDDKRSKIRMLLESYNQKELAIREKVWEEGEPLSREDKVQLAQLDQARQSEVASTLSPSELEQYELQMSPTAYHIRDAMSGLNPTEQEFQALYRLRKPFDDVWGRPDLDLNDPVTHRQWEEASQQLESQIKSTLGDQRYAEYKQGQDPDYQQAMAAASRFNLPPAKAAEVYQYKQIAQGYREQLRTDPLLSAEQKQAALDGIRRESEQALRQSLGDRAFNYYMRHSQAEWLRQ